MLWLFYIEEGWVFIDVLYIEKKIIVVFFIGIYFCNFNLLR